MSIRRFDWTVAAAAVAVLMILSTTALPASAASQLPGQFLGEAWGSRANSAAGKLATRMGKSAYQPCPCVDTDGRILTNTADNVDGGDSYRSGKVVTTAQTDKRAALTAFAQTTSKVTNIRALGGRITAASMQAVATVSANQASINPSYAGSAITGLKVNGQPVQADPGKRINLAGFGYVVFNEARIFRSPTGVVGAQVEMMRIVITRANNLNIPVGSVITSTHASVAYTRHESANLVSSAAWGAAAHSTSSSLNNRSGRVAPAYVGCFTQGVSSGVDSNSAALAGYAGIFSAETVASRAQGQIGTAATSSQASSRVQNVNLLAGVLTADVIRGVASSRVDATGGHSSVAGSRFVNLFVLGRAIGDNVAPNTTIAIPGLGTLTLYATAKSFDSHTAHTVVDMVVLHVNQVNSRGVPAGTDITLGHAQADARR